MTVQQLINALGDSNKEVVHRRYSPKPKNFWKAFFILNVYENNYNLRNKEVDRRFHDKTVNIIA